MARRPIFEDIAAGAPAAAPVAGGLIDAGPAPGARRAIRVWLAVLFVMVAAMIALGGATRLTGSGLSITEWRPVTGALPPASTAAWEAEFAKYQQIPQFREVNPTMDLAGFKRIYWWEWSHRLLGRLVGLVWAAGFAFFALTRRLPPGFAMRLALPGILGAVQGAVGWWMVSSGLGASTLTRVASTRLAVHLGLGFAILGLLAWLILRLSRSEAALLRARRAGEPGLFGMATGLMHLAFVQVLLGALVAGIDAGRQYTGWPKMGGEWLPARAFELEPLWRNFVENPALVQFIHRLVGYAVALMAVGLWMRARRSPHPVTRGAVLAVLVAVAVQLGLGILAVIHGAPLPLALAHQLGAVALFTLIVRARFHARWPVEASLRAR